MNLLIINGPNLNMLGIREPDIYGHTTYADLVDLIDEVCESLDIGFEVYQSNHEGEIVDKIQSAYKKFDGIIINPAAYTHTSVAILDALKAVGIKTIEVHLSNIHDRETFRHHSFISDYCEISIMGKGITGYKEAIEYFTTSF